MSLKLPSNLKTPSIGGGFPVWVPIGIWPASTRQRARLTLTSLSRVYEISGKIRNQRMSAVGQ